MIPPHYSITLVGGDGQGCVVECEAWWVGRYAMYEKLEKSEKFEKSEKSENLVML